MPTYAAGFGVNRDDVGLAAAHQIPVEGFVMRPRELHPVAVLVRVLGVEAVDVECPALLIPPLCRGANSRPPGRGTARSTGTVGPARHRSYPGPVRLGPHDVQVVEDRLPVATPYFSAAAWVSGRLEFSMADS
jgi:hypothetical protein